MRDLGKISRADQLLDLANAEPDRVLSEGAALTRQPDLDVIELSKAHRAMSIAARILGQYARAIEHAEMSRDAAEEGDDDESYLLAVLTMIGPLLITGRSGEARALLDRTAHLATDDYLAARHSYQWGVTFDLDGDVAGAINAYEDALPAFRAADDGLMVRSTLQNLGKLSIVTGDLSRAEGALIEALSIATARNEQPAISGIEHNLGRLASFRGDIPEALELLLDSDEIYMQITGSSAPQHVARCEVLLSAGLFAEALELASQVAETAMRAGDPEHTGNALVVAARAAQLAKDWGRCRSAAVEAISAFEDHDRPLLALEPRRILLEARFGSERPSADMLEEASRIAEELEADGFGVESAQAHLLAGQVATSLGESERAIDSLTRVARVSTGPLEVRIQAKLALTLLRLMIDDRRGAAAAARSGLRMIDEYQSVLGATDLRMGLERHGSELGSIGLGLAIESREPRRVLVWMEQTRARALRHQPVVPSSDEEVRDALSRLRQVESKLRETEQRGDPALTARRRRLQEEVREADRMKRSSTGGSPGFDLTMLMGALGDRTLIELAAHKGQMVGVLVRRGRARLVDLGSFEQVLAELTHVRFGMRRASRLGRGFDFDSLHRLDHLLFPGVDLGDVGEVVLIPPPSLMATPWAGLPTLAGRTLTISPSAEMWWRAHESKPSPGQTLVVGGPDLAMAGTEVSQIGALYPDAVVLLPGSGVEAVRDGMVGASVAHIACHATFQVENPMFSALRLGDGDLNVYDIERLEKSPDLVVLSACDSGYTEARSGDELAGLTSALLSMGTRWVVASVGLVPDSPATSDLMVTLHEGLVDGLEPARALARAQLKWADDPANFVAAASFICVGG